MKTLKNVMPTEFICGKFNDTQTYKFKDVKVIKEHIGSFPGCGIQWLGIHKNEYQWVELENGYVVGFIENPSRGCKLILLLLKLN